MAKVFSLKASRLQDLIDFLNNISNEEIGKIKPGEERKMIVRYQKLFEEVSGQNEEYSSLIEAIRKDIKKFSEKYQEEIDAVYNDESLPTEERQIKAKVLVRQANKALEEEDKAKAEQLNLEEVKGKMIEVKVNSDERFQLLMDVFDKLASSKFNGAAVGEARKAIVELSEALDSAKEL